MTVQFRLTRDPKLLAQYYALRQRCYRAELDLPDFDGSEDWDDRRGLILLAVQGGRCIAGARIVRAKTNRDQIREMGLRTETSCQWERFVFAPEARSVQLIRKFLDSLIAVSGEAGYHHALILSSKRNARFYRQCHSAMGVGFRIHGEMPGYDGSTFAGLEHYLSVSYLRDRLPLIGIGSKKCGRALFAQHRRELPAKIKAVVHRHIHALTCLGAVGVTGIASNKGARMGALIL